MTLRRPRLLAAAALAAGAALAVPASAEPLPAGVVNVVAPPQGSAVGYATPSVLSTAGTSLSFLNLDTTTHDVTSRKTRTIVVKRKKRTVPLFSAPITPGGAVSVIPGTDKLPAGTYDFYCSLHPGMTGSLTVQ